MNMENDIFDVDKEMERRLLTRWWSKWKLYRSLGKTISFAEKALNDDVRFLREAIVEKERQEDCMSSSHDAKSKARHELIYKKYYELEQIYNFIGFVDVNSIDICILSRCLLKEKDKWSRNLYARLSYAIMYELTEDVIQLLGNDKDKDSNHLYGVRSLVKEINDASLNKELNNTSKVWNDFWKKIGKNGLNYSEIRNTSAIHRDHNFLKQFDSLSNVSWGAALSDISEFNTMYTLLRCFIRDFMYIYCNKYNHDIEQMI